MTRDASSVHRTVMTSDEVSRAVRRMSHELLETTDGAHDVILAGIITRGVPLAHRVAAVLRGDEGIDVPVGALDITMYRDDLHRQPTRPVGRTSLPPVDGRNLVLVDDVIASGRTVQAALHAVADLGRPRAIRLMALVDRGGRELPVHADIIGRSLPTSRHERVRVLLTDPDGCDEVLIERNHS